MHLFWWASAWVSGMVSVICGAKTRWHACMQDKTGVVKTLDWNACNKTPLEQVDDVTILSPPYLKGNSNKDHYRNVLDLNHSSGLLLVCERACVFMA